MTKIVQTPRPSRFGDLFDMLTDRSRALLRWRDQPGADCGAVDALVDEHIEHIATRIRELRALERQLRALRARCRQASDTAHCGILVGLSQVEAAGGAAPALQHVGGTHGRH